MKVVLPEEDSDLVAAQWAEWQAEEFTIVAPRLFTFEVKAVLRQRVTRYDTAYLALAHILDCELWTADRRFLRTLGGKETHIRCVEL